VCGSRSEWPIRNTRILVPASVEPEGQVGIYHGPRRWRTAASRPGSVRAAPRLAARRNPARPCGSVVPSPTHPPRAAAGAGGRRALGGRPRWTRARPGSRRCGRAAPHKRWSICVRRVGARFTAVHGGSTIVEVLTRPAVLLGGWVSVSWVVVPGVGMVPLFVEACEVIVRQGRVFQESGCGSNHRAVSRSPRPPRSWDSARCSDNQAKATIMPGPQWTAGERPKRPGMSHGVPRSRRPMTTARRPSSRTSTATRSPERPTCGHAVSHNYPALPREDLTRLNEQRGVCLPLGGRGLCGRGPAGAAGVSTSRHGLAPTPGLARCGFARSAQTRRAPSPARERAVARPTNRGISAAQSTEDHGTLVPW
jgi:hypothetical protein